MALEISTGFAASGSSLPEEVGLPIFNVERVQLQFSIAADFVAAQVANNVLILALATGRILRIDLDNPADIDGATLQIHCSFHRGIADVVKQMSTCPRSRRRLASSGACSSTLLPRTSS